jgi:hypothetical protein
MCWNTRVGVAAVVERSSQRRLQLARWIRRTRQLCQSQLAPEEVTRRSLVTTVLDTAHIWIST